MPELVLDLLKFVFLGILYIFIARAVRAIYLELKPQQPRASGRPAAPPPRPTSRRTRKAPTKVAVIEGDLRGRSFDLDDELIIGRSDRCKVVLDDNYVSQMHARIFSRDDAYLVEDLGSTNGTYVNRRRITSPVEVQRGDRVKIGKTVLEMRK